jgi:hypothetical protein
MPTCVVICLNDDGQMLVGEVDPETINPEELEPVPTFEEAAGAAETLLLGEEPPPEIEEDAFNEASSAPDEGGL